LAKGSCVAVILAGGQARRMGGGDKSLLNLNGKTLLGHVIDALSEQTTRLIINANGNSARFSEYDLPVIKDTVDGFVGPLAGILAAMEWLALEDCPHPWLMSIPADTPFLPRDLVARLMARQEETNAKIVLAASGGRVHPVVGLWSTDLAVDLRTAVLDQKVRKIMAWAESHLVETVEFQFQGELDPFFNINTEKDLDLASAKVPYHQPI